MTDVLFVLLFAALLNIGCAASFNRAGRALRDLGHTWVRALSGRRLSGNPSA